MEHKEFVNKITAWIDDKKAEEVIHIDVSGKSDYTDSLIICSGVGAVHLKAIAEHVIEKCREHGFRTINKEGLNSPRWILLDLGEIVIHIFDRETRDYYKIEELWNIKRKEQMDKK
ncbi:MAG: ribosome silencing factor [Candidatus Cloacimonadota bacterium]|nr:ribosome silencing factor [Candidatus Cloacimonadota bacterium]